MPPRAAGAAASLWFWAAAERPSVSLEHSARGLPEGKGGGRKQHTCMPAKRRQTHERTGRLKVRIVVPTDSRE